ncbi:MAG: tetratricopeptide repeat-containing sulfotransferase family protein [Gammaproteobacteria bacterium]
MTSTVATASTLRQVVELINSGDADRAVLICREAVDRNPEDINMVALLGATLMKIRRVEEAEKFLRRAIDLAPSFAKPHEDLGRLLVELRRPEEAVTLLDKATRLNPKEEKAFFELGKALAMVGKGKEADEAFEKSFDLNPERKALALAAEHQKEGRLEEAERSCRDVLRTSPNSVDALRLLGITLIRGGRVDEAETQFRKAIAIAPDFVGALMDLGRSLKDQNQFEEAIDCFKKAMRLEPTNSQAPFLLASTLTPAALTYDALEAYERVLELRPNHPGAKLGLAHVLKTIGRQEEAVRAYRDCIELKPNNGETYWSMANLKTYRLSDDDIETMESKLDLEEVDEESRVNFLFALAKAYEDRGDFSRAWPFYVDGNAGRRALEFYDPVQTEVTNDTLVKVFDKPLFETHQGHGHPDTSPIFVVGLPRSGSTLIEQILASHSMVEGTSELPYLGQVAVSLNRNRADGINYPEAVRELGETHLNRLGKDYLRRAQLHRVEGTPHFVDKMPNNFPSIGLIHLILPNAKIIDARRYPLDSCLSCYRQLFARGQTFTYDLTDIGEYFLQYQRMMDHWHEVLPGRVLTVQYEDMVTDFENQVRRLIDYCDLPWEDACASFHETDRPVRTASSEQVRQPVYTKSIHFWRNHEQHLGELIEVLEPVLGRYAQYESINKAG